MDVTLARGRVLGSILNEGPQRIKDLAYQSNVSQPSMTVMVVGLEKRGWVKRLPDERDGRAVLVTLTRAGEKAVLRMREARASAFAEFLCSLPKGEVAKLEHVVEPLEYLIAQLEAAASTDDGP
ncbi:MAG: MarR family transcriptional regulator [Ilumatobacteraceae bacterium]